MLKCRATAIALSLIHISFMQRTALSALATKATLQLAFASGGVPMQEFVSSTLAADGQMIRRDVYKRQAVGNPTRLGYDSQLLLLTDF